jgi:hypothetical protein
VPLRSEQTRNYDVKVRRRELEMVAGAGAGRGVESAQCRLTEEQTRQISCREEKRLGPVARSRVCHGNRLIVDEIE